MTAELRNSFKFENSRIPINLSIDIDSA